MCLSITTGSLLVMNFADEAICGQMIGRAINLNRYLSSERRARCHDAASDTIRASATRCI